MTGTDATVAIIEPKGPFSWEAACSVLATFPPVKHHWAGTSELVRMAFPLDGDFTPVAAAIRPGSNGSILVETAGSDRVDAVVRQVARVFSLDHDGTGYPAVGERDPLAGVLMGSLPGLRPVCFTSPYETAAWAVISQRIGTAQAEGILERIRGEHGHELEIAGEVVRCFPRPERLLSIDAVPGLAAQKVERLHGVGTAALDGLLDADRLRALGPEDGPASVRRIPGIGPFWSQGIYLRGCGIVDVFPDEPLSIAALGNLHGLGDRPVEDALAELTDAFRPFRMWVCFLLRVAAGRGLIQGVDGREGPIRRAARSGRGRVRAPGP